MTDQEKAAAAVETVEREAKAPPQDPAAEPVVAAGEATEAAGEQAEAAVTPAPKAGPAGAGEAASPEAASPEAVAPEGDAAPKTRARRGRPRLRLEDLVVGTETHGKVVGISKFGAFVDIGAVTDGLVHISELSDRRVRNVEDVVKSGTAVDVWIKEVDVSKNRISLSMRRKPNRPLDSLRPGNVLTGRVTSVTRYGAFVDIGSETEGLVHVSEMSSGFVQNPQDVVEVGSDIQVRIKDIDKRRERISLSMKGLLGDVGSSDDGGEAVEPEVEEEPMPTVMELALRKALGDMSDEDDADSEAEAASGSRGADLGDVYARMLQEYREQNEDA